MFEYVNRILIMGICFREVEDEAFKNLGKSERKTNGSKDDFVKKVDEMISRIAQAEHKHAGEAFENDLERDEIAEEQSEMKVETRQKSGIKGES